MVLVPAISLPGDPAATSDLIPPPQVWLDDKDTRALSTGRRVFFTLPFNGVKLSGVAFRVAAKPDEIWRTLRSFDNYSKWVDNLSESTVYSVPIDERAPGVRPDATYVRFKVKHWLAGSYVYHVRHEFPWPAADWGVFQLHADRPNDFATAYGFWRVVPVHGAPGKCDVYYVAEIRGHEGMSGFFRRRFIRGGLKAATQWVRRIAERHGLKTGVTTAPANASQIRWTQLPVRYGQINFGG